MWCSDVGGNPFGWPGALVSVDELLTCPLWWIPRWLTEGEGWKVPRIVNWTSVYPRKKTPSLVMRSKSPKQKTSAWLMLYTHPKLVTSYPLEKQGKNCFLHRLWGKWKPLKAWYQKQINHIAAKKRKRKGDYKMKNRVEFFKITLAI